LSSMTLAGDKHGTAAGLVHSTAVHYISMRRRLVISEVTRRQ